MFTFEDLQDSNLFCH